MSASSVTRVNGDHGQCPDCLGPLTRDEVDIGVGVLTGPPHCMGCGWSPIEPDDDLLIDDGDSAVWGNFDD